MTGLKLLPEEKIELKKYERFIVAFSDKHAASTKDILQDAYGYKSKVAANLTGPQSKMRLQKYNYEIFCRTVKGKISSAVFPYDKKSQLAFTREFKNFKKKFDGKFTLLEKQEEEKHLAKARQKPIASAIQKKPTKAVSSLELHVSNNIEPHDFLNILQNTTWYCYEAELDKISREVITFTKPNSKGCLDFTYEYLQGPTWYGDVRFIDADDLLVGICRNVSADTVKKKGKINPDEEKELHYTHFAFQINTKSESLSVCIGHKTFFKQHHGNVVTKTVVLERVPSSVENILPDKFSKIDGNVHPNIRSFLADRKLNRLSSPHAIKIIDHASFETWINQNQKGNIDKYCVDSSILGIYQLIYCLNTTGNNEPLPIVKRHLEITRTENGLLKGIYSEEDSNVLSWEGLIYENADTNTLSMVLEGPQKEGRPLKIVMPLFILLYVSTKEEGVIDTLTGIIVGIRDKNAGPVARLTLLTKLEKYDETVIEKFFWKFKEGLRVRPPNDRIAMKFSDIKKMVE